jgi:hypothetical protein
LVVVALLRTAAPGSDHFVHELPGDLPIVVRIDQRQDVTKVIVERVNYYRYLAEHLSGWQVVKVAILPLPGVVSSGQERMALHSSTNEGGLSGSLKQLSNNQRLQQKWSIGDVFTYY